MLRANLTLEGADALEAWFRSNGTTVAAFLEALSEMVREFGADAQPSGFVGRFPVILKRAQEITVERRRRARNDIV